MKRRRPPSHPAARMPRPSRRIHEEPSGKLPEIAACPRCQASYRNGRWTWKAPPVGAYEHVCPACERIETDEPAGVLRAEGAFVAAHRDEIVRLLRNIEERERNEHPLKRIIRLEDEDDGLRVAATNAKLVETFGHALQEAYEGRLDRPPRTGGTERFVRIRWARD